MPSKYAPANQKSRGPKQVSASAYQGFGTLARMSLSDQDRRAVRARIRAWVIHFRALYFSQRTDVEMAEELGVQPSTLNGVISGKRTAGLDFVIALSRRFRVPVDILISAEPSAAWPMMPGAKILAPGSKN